MDKIIRLIIPESPPSKSNMYKIITIKRRNSRGQLYMQQSLAKSDEMGVYERTFMFHVSNNVKNLFKQKQWLDAIYVAYYHENRKDVDNSAKALFDCMQSADVIHNDRYIKLFSGYKVVDKSEKERVEIYVMEHDIKTYCDLLLKVITAVENKSGKKLF